MDTVLTGDEHIMFDGMPTGYLLHDFWAWASSDLLNNTLRGSYAEFIVATALDLTDMLKTPRKDWTAYDLYYPLDRKTGIRIEVKSAAYLQAWGEKDSRLSKIQFSIRPTLAWDAESGYDTISRHQSDVYVFCVYTEKERSISTAGTSMSFQHRFLTSDALLRRAYHWPLWRNLTPSRPIITAWGPPS